jgi:rhodanese-related sulfurtransferase
MHMIRRALLGLLGVLAACQAFAESPPPQATPAPKAATAQPAASTMQLTQVSQEALVEMLAHRDGHVLVLDVRTPQEFASGHVPGAVNIPHDQVASHLGEIPKDGEIVLYCHSGRRVMLAAEELAANGYEKLAHLEGDMRGWQQAGRPVEAAAEPAN